MPVCGTISIAFPPNAPPKNSTHTYDLICFDHDSVKNPRKHATTKKYTITDNFIRNFNVSLADSFDSDVYSVTRDSQKLSYVFLVKKKNNCNNQKSYIYNHEISEIIFIISIS